MSAPSRPFEPKAVARKTLKRLSAVTDRFGAPLQGPRVLIYHQVGAGNGVEMDLDRADFARQMQWLSSTGRVRSLDDVLTNLDTTDDAYVLTFDDGYQDMYENGFPILRDLGLPFVLYLTSEPIETRRPLRDDGLSTPVTWEAVGAMVSSGLATVGAHTHTHPDLRHLSSGQIEEELGTSNALIEKRTGVSPEHFTYPWGYWLSDADELVRGSYRSATVGGCTTTRFAAAHAIPRLPIQLSDGWTFFRPRLRGGFRLEDRIRRRVSRYEGP